MTMYSERNGKRKRKRTRKREKKREKIMLKEIKVRSK